MICVFFCSVYEGFTKSKKSLLFSFDSDSSSDITYEINDLLLPLCSPLLLFLGENRIDFPESSDPEVPYAPR